MLSHIQSLFAYQSWADALFFKCWAGSSSTTENADLRHRVDHLVMVQEGFLKVLRGEPLSRPPEGPLPSNAELRNRNLAVAHAYRSFSEGLREDQLKSIVSIPWFPKAARDLTVSDALVQVIMHSQHHRGQNMTMLKQIGGTTQNVDWIIWILSGRPEAAWD